MTLARWLYLTTSEAISALTPSFRLSVDDTAWTQLDPQRPGIGPALDNTPERTLLYPHTDASP